MFDHYGTKDKLRQMNIECGNHIARKMTVNDYKEFDYIICMEESNIKNIKRIIGEDKEKQDARLYLTYVVGNILKTGANLLGIEMPDRM